MFLSLVEYCSFLTLSLLESRDALKGASRVRRGVVARIAIYPTQMGL